MLGSRVIAKSSLVKAAQPVFDVEFDVSKIIPATFMTVTRELSGRVLDLRPKGHGFKPYWRHCDVSLSKTH